MIRELETCILLSLILAVIIIKHILYKASRRSWLSLTSALHGNVLTCPWVFLTLKYDLAMLQLCVTASIMLMENGESP